MTSPKGTLALCNLTTLLIRQSYLLTPLSIYQYKISRCSYCTINGSCTKAAAHHDDCLPSLDTAAKKKKGTFLQFQGHSKLRILGNLVKIAKLKRQRGYGWPFFILQKGQNKMNPLPFLAISETISLITRTEGDSHQSLVDLVEQCKEHISEWLGLDGKKQLLFSTGFFSLMPNRNGKFSGKKGCQ